MSDMRLLTSYEILDISAEQIKESREKNGGRLILKGIVQRADALNQNGRVYPRNILEREIRNYQKFIIENRAMGEADHPDSSVVSLQKVSHIMREAVMDEDGVVRGSVEILGTPCGKIVESLIDAGVKVGISSRGVGSVKQQGDYLIVQDDFQLIAFDMVADPSTPQAFMLPEGRRLAEGLDMNKVFNKSDRLNRIANEILFPKK